MASTDRFDDRVDQAGGKAKEWAGKLTDNERLEAEGKSQHEVAETKGDLKEAADKVKDAFRR